jgi:hypothetical protein
LAESYAILTVAANPEVALYQERQGALLLRQQRMEWLDATVPEAEVLRPAPTGSFRVDKIPARKRRSSHFRSDQIRRANLNAPSLPGAFRAQRSVRSPERLFGLRQYPDSEGTQLAFGCTN